MAVEKYKNLGGNSGAVEFELGEDSIVITFVDGSKYLYSGVKPGSEKVDRLKKLAIAGRGLCTYINTDIRNNYEKKLR